MKLTQIQHILEYKYLRNKACYATNYATSYATNYALVAQW